MKLFSRSISIAFCAVTVAAVAVPKTAEADSGLYVGASAGAATIESDFGLQAIPGLPSRFEEDDTAFKVFAGYNFDLPVVAFGIEAGYVDFGRPEIATTLGELTFDTTGFNVWGIAALDTGLVELFGKLGYIAWEVDGSLIGQSASEDGSDIGYGLGLRFGLGPVMIRGEYELYDLDDIDVSMLSVGVSYQFD